jgi:hypothetical protein
MPSRQPAGRRRYGLPCFLYIDLKVPTAHNPLVRLVLTLSGRSFPTFQMATLKAKFRLVFQRSRTWDLPETLWSNRC